MTDALVLGAGTLHKTLWYPTILGILAVVAGIALFCGSIYVLLGTNLGARLGFLVSFTALMGFMVLLTLLWMTTASPLNTLHGRTPSWKVEEIVADPANAKTEAIRDLDAVGRQVGETQQADIKAAVDETLILEEEVAAEGPLEPGDNKFAKFELVTDYKVLQTLKVGGSNPNPLEFEITHEPLYAVVEFCEMQVDTTTFGLPPDADRPCSSREDAERGFLVMRRDLGSIRVPPLVAFGGSVLLFGLGLLCLHWRERDEKEAEERTGALVPATVET